MITPKHDPTELPWSTNSFRSVVSSELLEHPEMYYQSIAHGGTALYSNKHGEYCYVWGVPSYMAAGSAIPPGSAMPTRPMDAYLVAHAFKVSAHIYAADDVKIQAFLDSGEYEFLPQCSVEDCDNCQMPGTTYCVAHINPPKADE